VDAGPEEIKRRVLGFGRHAEVLGPEGLRGEMAEELTAIREHYTQKLSTRRTSTPMRAR